MLRSLPRVQGLAYSDNYKRSKTRGLSVEGLLNNLLTAEAMVKINVNVNAPKQQVDSKEEIKESINKSLI